MRRILLPLLPLLCTALGACDNRPGRSGDDAEPAIDSVADFGPVALYSRQMLFLAPAGTPPIGAVLDFSALTDSATVRGGVRARVVAADEWTVVADTAWSLPAVRQPWRILPAGPVRVTVDDDGEVAAVLVGDSLLRLETGPILAETRLEPGTQFVVRQADLLAADTVVRGVLLDARLGRSVDRAAAPAHDSVLPPTPLARPGAAAFLANSAGYLVVLGRSGGGQLAWVSGREGEEVRQGATLSPAGGSESGGEDTPAAWVVHGGEGLAGELRTLAGHHTVLRGVSGAAALDYALVGGWIEDRGVRRDVVGLVRLVR